MSANDQDATRQSVEPFVRWLDEYGDSQFSGLADDLCDAIPQLGAALDLRHALHRSIVSHLPTLRSALLGDDAVLHLPDPAREFACMTAELDVPVSAVLRSYELGHSAVWNEFAEHLRRQTLWSTSRRALALETGSLRMFRYMQAMTGQTIAEFESVQKHLARQTNSRRKDIVDQVLARAGGLNELEEVLGYRINEVHIGYVAWSTNQTCGAEIAEVARRHISGLTRQHVAVPTESVVHGWFTPSDSSVFDKVRGLQLSRSLQLAVGAPRPGHEGFIHTHQEAQLTAEMASVSESPLRFPDVAVAVLATRDKELANRFVNDHLGPLLLHEDAERLIATLRQYLDCLGSPTHCSRSLGVHPNTVVQRIQRAENILGQLIEPADLALRLALHLAGTPSSVSTGFP